MRSHLMFVVSTLAVLSSVSFAAAECGIEGGGSVRILGNDFVAIRVVAEKAKECAGEGVTVTTNLTTEHKNIQGPALKANPAEYTTAIVANGTLVPLLNEGLIRPLDELVEKYGQDLLPMQKIVMDGKVMAIAFMANAQHLYYREDVLAEAGVEPPKTYEEVLAAAKAIKDKGIMDYPLSGTYKAGWDMAEEFVNMYLGHGGEFFKAGSAEPNLNNEQGVAALKMMKSLSEYMNPDYLTYDSNAVNAEWDADRVAMVNLWGSRAPAMLDDQGASAEVVSATKLAGPPTVGGKPATTLWWDGFTIAKNISDQDAEATFQAMVHAISPSTATDNPDVAVWLIKGYTPGPNAVGVAAAVQAGAKPYPMEPYMGLIHTALGNEIVEFMQGKESAEKALADAEAAYRAAAREAGFIK